MGIEAAHRPAAFLAGFLIFAAAAIPASAQQEIPEFVEQERRAEMGPDAKLADDFFWDMGGWLRLDAFFVDDKPFKDQRAFRFYDLRLWGLLEFEGMFRIYARMFNHWIEFNDSDGFGDDDVWRRVRPDVFWAEGRFNDVLFPGMALNLRIGRQFMSVGRGTLFFDNADGLKMEIDSDYVDFDFFAARSIRHTADIDQTRPDPGESRRMFYGAELKWSGIENHILYLMGFVNDDKNGDRTAFQDFNYESEYIGAGVKGNPIARVSYQVESIFEFGTSIAEFTQSVQEIRAWSTTARVQWVPDTEVDAEVHFEYLFGSGDSDRASPAGTIGGNDFGSSDYGFVPFGFVQTGYALFPRLSNIHVLKAGGSVKPFLDSDTEIIRDMEFGGEAFYFFKHHHQGGISDGRATLPDRDVGQEVDLYWRWRLLSDVGLTARLGLFFPGDAYPSAGGANDLRKFFTIGFVFSF